MRSLDDGAPMCSHGAADLRPDARQVGQQALVVRVCPTERRSASRAREEILANIARQLGELRTYFASFDASLADCASRLDYSRQARWVGSRVYALFAPAVTLILATDGDSIDASPAASAGGAGGYPGSPAAPSPASKSPKSILKGQPSGVTPAPYAPPPAYFSPPAGAPAAAAPSWPPRPSSPSPCSSRTLAGLLARRSSFTSRPCRAPPTEAGPAPTRGPDSTPGPPPRRPRRPPPLPLDHQRSR